METTTLSTTRIKQILQDLLLDIAPEIDFDDLEPNEDVRAAYDIDSFDFLNFLVAVEENLGVTTPESDYGKLVSFDDITNYIVARLPKH